MKSRVFYFLMALVLFVVPVSPRPHGIERLSPRLVRALETGDPAQRTADGRLKVWVRFTDKGMQGDELAAALEQLLRSVA